MTDLAAAIRKATEEDGLVELVLRVSRYDALAEAAGEPAAWQAIVKYRDRPAGPWGVGIRANPVAAIRAALEDTRSTSTPPKDEAPSDALDIFG